MDVGGIEGQNGVWCLIRWRGITRFWTFGPFSASLSTLSFHATFVWAMLVFPNRDLMFRQLMVGVMWANSSLTKWLSRKCMLLRLFLKINVSVFRGLVCSIAKNNL